MTSLQCARSTFHDNVRGTDTDTGGREGGSSLREYKGEVEHVHTGTPYLFTESLLGVRRGSKSRCIFGVSSVRLDTRRSVTSLMTRTSLQGTSQRGGRAGPWPRGRYLTTQARVKPPATHESAGAACGWGRGSCARVHRPSSGSSTWSRASARSPTARTNARPPPSPGHS